MNILRFSPGRSGPILEVPMADLKSWLETCPFCGSAAVVKPGFPLVLVTCLDCTGRTMGDTEQEAVTAWNARPTSSNLTTSTETSPDGIADNVQRNTNISDLAEK